jgi:hypothetical protein
MKYSRSIPSKLSVRLVILCVSESAAIVPVDSSLVHAVAITIVTASTVKMRLTGLFAIGLLAFTVAVAALMLLNQPVARHYWIDLCFIHGKYVGRWSYGQCAHCAHFAIRYRGN